MTEALSNLFKYKQFGNTGFKIFEVALFLNHEEDYTLARLEKTFVKNKSLVSVNHFKMTCTHRLN